MARSTTKKDYALTIDTAKEISMLQRTEKGKQARYFIECENKPRTHLEVQNQKWFIDRE
jgi:anti-repressor protein